MDARKIQESIKQLELENARNVALKENAISELCTLLNCKPDGIDAAIETLRKRKEAAEVKIGDLEAKIIASIPPEYQQRFQI